MRVIYNRNNVRMIGPAVLVPGVLTEIPDDVWPSYANAPEVLALVESGDLVIAEEPKPKAATKPKPTRGSKPAAAPVEPEGDVSDDELSDLLG